MVKIIIFLYYISIVLLNIDGANKKVVLLIRYTATRVNKGAIKLFKGLLQNLL
jgi:hypothetical protein